MKIDRASLLAQVDAATTLGEAEETLRAEGFTLRIARLEERQTLAMGEWLSAGAPDAPDAWSDPPIISSPGWMRSF